MQLVGNGAAMAGAANMGGAAAALATTAKFKTRGNWSVVCVLLKPVKPQSHRCVRYSTAVSAFGNLGSAACMALLATTLVFCDNLSFSF